VGLLKARLAPERGGEREMAEVVSVQITVGGEGQYFFRYFLAPVERPEPPRSRDQLPDVRVLPLHTSILTPGLSLPVPASEALSAF